MTENNDKKITEDKLYLSVSPSQWINFSKFLVYGFITLLTLIIAPMIFGIIGLLLALAPLSVIIWNYLIVNMWKIEINEEKLIQTKGVFNLKTDELQIYRIKDISSEKPFWLRLVGLSNINLISSDKSDPFIKIPAVKNGDDLREQISNAIEKMRRKKGVREFD